MPAKSKAELPPTLDVVLKNLAERSVELDRLDDKLGALIRRIESVLRTQISTRISHEFDPDPNDGEVELLTFGKHDGKFMLLLEHGVQDFGAVDIKTCTPLLSTSREMRTRVFTEGYVEQLIRSAHAQVSQQIMMREKALAAAEQIANALDPFSVSDGSTTSDPWSDDDPPRSSDDLPF